MWVALWSPRTKQIYGQAKETLLVIHPEKCHVKLDHVSSRISLFGHSAFPKLKHTDISLSSFLLKGLCTLRECWNRFLKGGPSKDWWDCV